MLQMKHRTKVAEDQTELDKWDSESILECPICGKYFLKPKRHIQKTDNSFCSMSCYGEHQQSDFTKEYGNNWEKIRKKVLERDEYLCRRCFDDAKEVHHIIKKQHFDDNKEANQLNNLVSLCYDCHSYLEGLSEDKQREEIQINSNS